MKTYLDKDGYPTKKALKLIRSWDHTGFEGLMIFVKRLWWNAEWGWGVVEKGELLHHKEELAERRTYYLSTGGWSGNEEIIRAMKDNWVLWMMTWYQSRRGGHYIFEAPRIVFKEQNSTVVET